MLLQDLVDVSRRVGSTRSRRAKVATLAEALAAAPAGELPVVATYLSGRLRQRRTGVGWRSLTRLPGAAERPTLTVAEVDAAFDRLADLSGPGSQSARAAALADLLARATPAEQAWLRGAITGEVRQGALDSLLQEAVAQASGVPLTEVRRAAMLAGSTIPVAVVAMTEGREALGRFQLEVGRPVQPMLASSAPDVGAAIAKVGGQGLVEVKLDGIRVQAHKDGDRVHLATRTLEDITARLPEVVDVVASLPVDRAVLDGEAVTLDDQGRARPFQETSARTASGDGVAVTPYFFDLLLEDGTPLLDEPARVRRERLRSLVPEQHLLDHVLTDEEQAAQSFLEEALTAGHEGVVVKDPEARYAAGRRGSAWVKVKPVHTLDLVVLAVEEGSGRRRGWLSNIHLGAREAGGGFAMLGKTFKGMTDETLAWQTERFTDLATHRDGHVVHVRPEQVVEIAFDGVQRSTRYASGMALRFARVVRYRHDKTAADADSVEEVRRLAGL